MLRRVALIFLALGAAGSALDSAPTFQKGNFLFITQDGLTNKLYRYRDSDTVFVTEFASQYQPIYYVNETNGFLYLHNVKTGRYFILNINQKKPTLTAANDLPDGFNISSVPSTGDDLLLTNRIDFNEHPQKKGLFERGRIPEGIPSYMLYRYNRISKELACLTFSNSQHESAITPDGRYCLYRTISSLYDKTVYYDLIFRDINGGYGITIEETSRDEENIEGSDITASPLNRGFYSFGGLNIGATSDYSYFNVLPSTSYSGEDNTCHNTFRYLICQVQDSVLSYLLKEITFRELTPAYAIKDVYYCDFLGNSAVFSATKEDAKETVKLFNYARLAGGQVKEIPKSEGVIYCYYFKGTDMPCGGPP